MDFNFTAGIEKQFDEIAAGDEEWHHMVRNFYDPFHNLVEKTISEKGRAAETERELGKDPASGLTVHARMTRFGPVVQIGKTDELPEGVKPKYANLTRDFSLQTIDLEQALSLFQLPKDLGEYKNQAVSVGVGRYGPYIKFGETFVSIPKGEDPLSIDLDRAIEMIRQKQEADAPIGTYKGLGITKGKGRFGPFIKWNGLYINVPKRIDFDHLKADECIPLIESKVEKESNKYIRNWEEEKISLENGRFGPFIRFGKKFINLPRVDGKKVSAEEAANYTLEEVKAVIETEMPGVFSKKKTGTRKKVKA